MEISRRRFIYTTGTGVLACANPVWPRTINSDGPMAELTTHRETARAFGTQISITVEHESVATAKTAVAAALREMELVEELMSIYRTDSQLSRLNREGRLTQPHPYVIEIFQQAIDLSRRTRGAFDITVQPLWELYRKSREDGEYPSKENVAGALEKVDWRRLHAGPEKISLGRPAVAVTLNGIAQGFATDRVAATLQHYGIRHALIDTGEVGTIGRKSSGDDWLVGVQHPRQPDAFVTLAKIAGRFLATSGDYESSFSDDFRAHHIFDPKSGVSPTELSSVSVLAPTGVQADSLSTAVFVLGMRRGVNLIRSIRSVDALLVRKDGKAAATEGFPLAETADRHPHEIRTG